MVKIWCDPTDPKIRFLRSEVGAGSGSDYQIIFGLKDVQIPYWKLRKTLLPRHSGINLSSSVRKFNDSTESIIQPTIIKFLFIVIYELLVTKQYFNERVYGIYEKKELNR